MHEVWTYVLYVPRFLAHDVTIPKWRECPEAGHEATQSEPDGQAFWICMQYRYGTMIQ
jgi:hypothetical protein